MYDERIVFCDVTERTAGVLRRCDHPPGPPLAHRDGQAMKYLLRLDLERVRSNLESTRGAPQTHDDVMRLLAGMKVWRRDEEWFMADGTAMRNFLDGEVLENRPAP